MSPERDAVAAIVAAAMAAGRESLDAAEAHRVCTAYGIPMPPQGVAQSAAEAVRIARGIGYPVVAKIDSPDILHKTDVAGVVLGIADDAALAAACDRLIEGAKAAGAHVAGVLVQRQMDATPGAQETLVGAVTDPVFGKLVAFGLGGVLVEALGDVTFRLAPAGEAEAEAMLGEIAAATLLDGPRGAPAVNRGALARLISRVSQLAADVPAIHELDLNPVFASAQGATAVDARILLKAPAAPPHRPAQEDILAAMRRIMQPDAVAVIGASAEDGKIGNSVMRNLIDGGYPGKIHPIHPRADAILGHPCHKSVTDVPGDIDIAIFCIPARFVAGVLGECGEKGIPGAILIPSGFAEVGEAALQDEVVAVARANGVRLMGPNIYGFYYTHKNLCATFCTPYTERGKVALSSQSGGVGMAIVGFSRSAKMGVSAIVGLGNKADIDEDDLLAFFEQDPNTQVIAMHVEDLKDGRAFAEAAARVSKRKPVVVLKAGRTRLGARAANSHTGALAGDDRVYDAVLRQSGVIRAMTLNDMLEFARGLQVLPTPKGENVLILTGAGGSGVLLSDACVDHDLTLMAMPEDLDAAFKSFIPPFGASGNPVDITGGEPPSTYRATIDLALGDDRIHALVLGYWHTIVTPPMVFAELVGEAVAAARAQGIDKPVAASLVGDVEIEAACEYLMDRDILAYPYTAEKPVAVLGAKYRWARAAGLIAPAG